MNTTIDIDIDFNHTGVGLNDDTSFITINNKINNLNRFLQY